jgi:micrococcal nuclease
MSANPYTYKIKNIVRYVDGDTVDVLIDLGFDITIKKRVRLYGINTPEIRTRDLVEKKAGFAAKTYLEEACALSESTSCLLLESVGIGKFGRVLGNIYNDNININQLMISEGHATEYYGR